MHVCVSSQHECCGISQMFTLCVRLAALIGLCNVHSLKIPFRAHSQLGKSAHTHTHIDTTKVCQEEGGMLMTGAPSLQWETRDTDSDLIVIRSDVNRKGSDISHNDKIKKHAETVRMCTLLLSDSNLSSQFNKT